MKGQCFAMLFTDEVGLTRDGTIMSFHNIRIWVADNPHITMASRHQH
jgi:hypothetical protein